MAKLTYFTYDTGDPAYIYSGEICYNPTLDEVWMNYCFLADNPTGDDLVRIAVGSGAIVGDSALTATGSTDVGIPGRFDSVTDAVAYRATSAGNKLLVVDSLTRVVTSHTGAGYANAYNGYGSGALRYYAIKDTEIDTVNIATGAYTLFTNTLPPSESFFGPDMTFSSSSVGWRLGWDTYGNLLHKYNLGTGAITATYTMPGAWTGIWLVYSPVNDAVYCAVADGVSGKSLLKFDIASTTFSLAWSSTIGQNWPNSSDSAPILSYDPYRDLIWFTDGEASSFSNGDVVAGFDPATDSMAYSFSNAFPASTQTPWKYVIAPSSVWVSENNNDQVVQLLKITFPHQPRVWVSV